MAFYPMMSNNGGKTYRFTIARCFGRSDVKIGGPFKAKKKLDENTHFYVFGTKYAHCVLQKSKLGIMKLKKSHVFPLRDGF